MPARKEHCRSSRTSWTPCWVTLPGKRPAICRWPPFVGYESATASLIRPPADSLTQREESGAEGSRTLDLLNAIQALSQLSYGPTRREESERRRAYSPMIATGQPNSGRPAGGTLASARYHSRPPDSLVNSASAQCYRPDGDVVVPSARARDPTVATRDTRRAPQGH